jgi:hypothetical protein
MSSALRQIVCASLLAAFVIIANGCSNSKDMPSGRKHGPSDPSKIVIYQTKPDASLERLGIVETTEDVRWQDRNDVTPMVENLKKKAAALGANGIILEVPPEPGEKMVRAQGTYQGKSYEFAGTQIPVKKATAIAIYVLPQ